MNDEKTNSIRFDSELNAENSIRLNLLYEIGRILASLETMSEAAPQILEAICRNLRFELGELWCLSKNDTVLHLESVWHLPSPLLEKIVAENRSFKFSVGEGLPGKVWAKNAPVWIENISTEDNMPRRFFAEETGLKSGFAFPILLGEKFIGAFSFFTREPQQPDDTLFEIFTAVGSHIGQFVKRERTESYLRESEENFRAFVQASSQAIWTTSANGQNLEAFGWWENQTGQTREQSAGAGFLKAIHPEDRERIGRTWRTAMESITAFETECRIADYLGNYHHFAIRGVPVFNMDDSFRQWIGTLTDINDRKLAERAIKRNEERYRALVEATSTVVWRANENGELKFVGSSWENVSGQTVEEILGSGWLDALHPDDRETTIQVWKEAVAAKSVYETEFRILTTNGEYHWFAVRGVPILNDDGSVREWVGANTDVHQRKLAEQAVRESEESYRIVAETASDAIIKIDTDSRILFVNSAVERIFGHRAETMIGEPLTMIMPENLRDRHLAGFHRYLETGERHLSWEGLEIPALNANGQTFPLEVSFGEYNEQGKRFFIGIARDITDRKSAERAVRESEANFRQLAEAVPQFVWVTETDGSLSYVNRQWTEFSGLTLEQTSDPKMSAAVFHPDDAPRLAKEWEKSFLNGKVLEIEVRLRNLQGEYRWFLTRSRPVKDADGKIIRWFGTSTDITDGKQAENRLSLLAGISELTRTTEDANELLYSVSEAIGEHLQVRRCLFNEIDVEADREIVHRDYCRGVESVAGIHKISDYSPITSADMAAGKTVVNKDSKTDSRTTHQYEKIYAPNGERAYIAVPLLRNNRWTASLWVSDDKPHEWSAQEISLLETIAERTWTAIEKIRINNDLRQSEERLQLAIDISRISTFEIDLKTDWVETDETGRAIYGFELDEPLTFAKIQSRFHAEDRDEVGRQVSAAFAPEGSDEFEVEQRIIRPSGEVRWIRVRGRAFFEGEGAARQAVQCLGTYIDITNSKVAEAALLERERLALLNADVSRALIKDSSLPDILHTCTDAVVTHLDAAFARIWTLNKAENVLELQASSGMYTHLDGEHSRVPIGKFKIGIIAEERQPHLTNSVIGDVRVGNQEWAIREKMAAFAGYPLLVEDRLVGVVAMFARQPLTKKTIEALAVAANAIALGIERKQTESERERLLISEQQAREVAEEANHAKDEFIALVSHELRSPLNAMLGWTRILQNQNPDEKTKEYALDVIVRNARSQSRLIEDLLDIARVSRGKLRLEMEPTELIPIIDQAVEIVKPTIEANEITFTQKLDRVANFITADVDRLRQVIENLLSNAVKFTTSGNKVEIRLIRENNDAKIIVSDTGQGISPEFLPQIFERFKQADPSTTRRHGGLGIGLSLARDLVELHGGTISAASAGEGKGSTFTVTLPLRIILPIKESSDKVEFMDSQGKLSGYWILAVDDEADARELVSFMLQINGAKVTTANSAVEALDILKSSGDRLPDVLLSDISMPNESGYALLEKIRALPQEHGGQIPAVALTAFNRPEDREAAFEAGFQKHLGKPVEPEDLISAIIETAGRQ